MKFKRLLQLLAMVSKFVLYGIVFQCFFASFLLALDSEAQKIQSVKEVYVKLDFKDATLKEVFNIIERNTGYSFAYEREVINSKISFNRSYNEKTSLSDVLLDISKEAGLHFKQINNSIIVDKAIKFNEINNDIEVIIQTKNVTGKVTSQEESDGIPGVNVLEKGTSNGTVTDIQGNFTLEVSEGATLVFSSVGYTTQEVAVGNQTFFNIVMNQDVQQLDELVVIGYGEMKRSDLTGSVVSVESEDLVQTMTPTLDQALQGRAAGVQVRQTSGRPGGGVSINIRGAGSIVGNNEPLYIVDGVQISGEVEQSSGFDWAGGGNGQNGVNTLSFLNINDIESVEVLKDASATAIYGSRAANGVVIITTKKGKPGKVSVNYDGFYGMQTVQKQLDLLNLREYAEYRNEIGEEYGSGMRAEFADPSLLGDGTNWQDEVFQLAPMQSHDVSLSGGNDYTTYAFNLGYFDQEGIVAGSGFERFNLRLNIENKATKWLTIGGNATLSRMNEAITLNDDNSGVISLALRSTPDIPVRNPDGSFGFSPLGENSRANPLGIALLRDLDVKRTRILVNTFANVNLLEGLHFRTTFGSNIGFNNSYGFNPTYNMGPFASNELAQSRRQFDNNLWWMSSSYLTYTRDFTTFLSGTIMAGMEFQETNWEGLSGGRTNFISNDIQALNAGDATSSVNSQYAGNSGLASYFGRANFTLLDKILLTATIRADGSSNFGPNNKWGYFPSFALGYQLNEEPFMENLDFISNLKIRASWGQTGNQDIPAYGYGMALTNYQTVWGPGLLASRYANPDLKWETTTSINLGLDVSLFQNRVELLVDVYDNITSDLLSPLPLPLSMGSSGTGSISAPYFNLGEIQNRGFELTVNTVNTTGELSWNSALTFTLNRNEILSLNNENAVFDKNVQWFDHVTRSTIGKPLGQFYGYVVEGIFQSAEEIRNHADQGNIDKINGVWPGDLKFKDISGPEGEPDGVIDDLDRTFIGDPNPDFTFGLNNSFSYKNFDFAMFIIGSVGNDLFNYTRRFTESLQLGDNQLATANDRARLELIDENGSATDPDNIIVENPGTSVPRMTPFDPNDNRRISSRYVEDGSFVRIKTLSLGYNLPGRLLSSLNMSKARVYVNVQNLVTFSNYSGLDPEIGPFNQDLLLNGIDNGNFPLPRIYTLGINVGF
ncbi:MAG: SusC/RagA family TonB-linked outer membrane protein [Cyclobacteriaceae bacterium]